jgi:hypothetical protein
MKNKHKVYNEKQFIKIMKNESKKDNYVYTAHIIFNSLFICKYKYPSRINHNDISSCPTYFKGYWKNGKLYPFPKKLIIKEQNTYMGMDR